MHIVVGKEAAESLTENYTILELETFKDSTGNPVTAYCVISAEDMPLLEVPSLERYKKLHADFISAFNEQNYKLCVELAEDLKGRFGGQVDSFYDIIVERISPMIA